MNGNERTSEPVIDVHAHYLPPEVVTKIEHGAFPYAKALGGSSSPVFEFPDGTTRATPTGMMDLDQRLRHMDDTGVDIQVMSTWNDMYGYAMPEREAIAYHKAINEGLAGATGDRFRFFASVPLPWGDAAAEVLEDAHSRLGAVGAMIGTRVLGSELDDPRMDAFFTAAERLGMPVELHPVHGGASERIDRFGLDNFLGFPFDTTIAASTMIMSGFLDRHPDLTVILVHGGGYLPQAISRIAYGGSQRGFSDQLRRPVPEYLRRFRFDTLVYSPNVLGDMTNIVGADNIVFGTDYPFDMEPHNPVQDVTDGIGGTGLTTTTLNARALFHGAL